MGLSTAERNKRKRERKKREKEERRRKEAEEKAQTEKENHDEAKTEDEVEIEYVVEPIVMPPNAETSQTSSDDAVPDGLPPPMGAGVGDVQQAEAMENVLRRFHQRAAVSAPVVSDDEKKSHEEKERKPSAADGSSDEEDDSDHEGKKNMSKRKLRELLRPSVAELKRRVKRPDLVEAHDVTANYCQFLIELKSIPGTVKVPRHWGRKRKYLQGKRGFEKPPFKLPDFIVKTGITDIRETVAEDEAKQTAKQSNRSRVNPKMGAMDVDYKTLYEAFFRYQTKPTDLTKFGDLYYEGRELETSTDIKPGGPFSKELREALGIVSTIHPPPWLINMQRYGPPPSYPNLAIPGLNAPLPSDQCQYGYHSGGWGKPNLDPYGRPLYGGNPFDPPGTTKKDDLNSTIVTSDGKQIEKAPWGSLPMGADELEDDSEVEESSEEESSVDDMDESDAEEEDTGDGTESVLPPPPTAAATAPGDLRKQTAGDETPMVSGPKQLYQVLQTKEAEQKSGVFQDHTTYVLPGSRDEGVESVLSKAIAPSETAKRKRKHDDDNDEEELAKNFKF